MENIIDMVLEQIQEDVEAGDLTAIQELLSKVPMTDLQAFLPEERWAEFG